MGPAAASARAPTTDGRMNEAPSRSSFFSAARDHSTSSTERDLDAFPKGDFGGVGKLGANVRVALTSNQV